MEIQVEYGNAFHAAGRAQLLRGDDESVEGAKTLAVIGVVLTIVFTLAEVSLSED